MLLSEASRSFQSNLWNKWHMESGATQNRVHVSIIIFSFPPGKQPSQTVPMSKGCGKSNTLITTVGSETNTSERNLARQAGIFVSTAFLCPKHGERNYFLTATHLETYLIPQGLLKYQGLVSAEPPSPEWLIAPTLASPMMFFVFCFFRRPLCKLGWVGSSPRNHLLSFL